MTAHRTPAVMRRARHQHGIVLFIALIVMVAMALAGIALVRQVDSAVLIAGNIAFKQSATNAGEQGIEAARAWMLDPTVKNTLANDNIGQSYISNWQSTIDLTGTDDTLTDFDWNAGARDVFTPTDAAGNRVRYVIHRLCAQSNIDVVSTSCARVASTSVAAKAQTKGQSSGVTNYQGGFNLSPNYVFYRVTVRIDGPRNTVSYVQSLLF